MTIRLVDRDGVIVRYAEDDLPPAGGLVSALAGRRVVDELTGLPPRAQVVVSTTAPGTPRVTSGGLVGLAGIPRQAFPDLASAADRVVLTIGAERFIPRSVTVPVPHEPLFPDHFAPPVLDQIGLHRAPVTIEGRVVQVVGAATAPLAGASVQVTGIWRQAPSATVVVPPDPPDLVALEPPLQGGRDVTTGTLAPLPLTPIAGDAPRTLLEDAPAGATRVRVSNAHGIVAPGTRLAIDAGDVDRREYGDVSGLEAATTPDQPAFVTLTLPLVGPHRNGAAVTRMAAGAAGAARALSVEALAGDTVIFLASLAGLTSGETTVVSDGTPADEYHHVRIFEATTDAAGYYRLPGLSRVAQIAVRAQSGALTPVTIELRPDYTQPIHRLDFILS